MREKRGVNNGRFVPCIHFVPHTNAPQRVRGQQDVVTRNEGGVNVALKQRRARYSRMRQGRECVSSGLWSKSQEYSITDHIFSTHVVGYVLRRARVWGGCSNPSPQKHFVETAVKNIL